MWGLPPLLRLVGQKKAKPSPSSSPHSHEIRTHLQIQRAYWSRLSRDHPASQPGVLQEPVHGASESSPSVPQAPASGLTTNTRAHGQGGHKSFQANPHVSGSELGMQVCICTHVDIHKRVCSVCASMLRIVKEVVNTGQMCAHTSDTIYLVWHFLL